MDLASQNNDSSSPLTGGKPSLNNKTRVVILQHPQEKKEPLATAPLLLNSLSRCELYVGLSWANLKKLLKEEVDYSKWAVIYLGTQAESAELLKQEKEVILLGSQKKIEHLSGIVVLDGSWREAKALWWRNPWLLKLNRIVLNPKKSSIYSTLRREPRKQSLSTLESVGMTLSSIENKPEVYDHLLTLLQELIKENKGKAVQNRGTARRFRRR